MKVLVIDDEPDVMEVVNLCFSLRWPEADVTSAKDAEEGLKYLEKDPPDIILLDIVLQGMDGFQLCEEVRRISDVPIVMLSARDGEVDTVRGLGRGAGGYIQSPFSHLHTLSPVGGVRRRCSVR